MKRPIKPRKPLKTTKRGFFMLMLGKELVYSIYDRNKLKNLQNITDTLRLECDVQGISHYFDEKITLKYYTLFIEYASQYFVNEINIKVMEKVVNNFPLLLEEVKDVVIEKYPTSDFPKHYGFNFNPYMAITIEEMSDEDYENAIKKYSRQLAIYKKNLEKYRCQNSG